MSIILCTCSCKSRVRRARTGWLLLTHYCVSVHLALTKIFWSLFFFTHKTKVGFDLISWWSPLVHGDPVVRTVLSIFARKSTEILSWNYRWFSWGWAGCLSSIILYSWDPLILCCAKGALPGFLSLVGYFGVYYCFLLFFLVCKHNSRWLLACAVFI